MKIFKWFFKRRRGSVDALLRDVAAPTIEKFEDQTSVAKAELAQQRAGTSRESRLRQRVLSELDLELRLFRYKPGKTR